MSDDTIKVTINNKEIVQQLNELAKRAKNVKPVLREIGLIMQNYVDQNFETEGRNQGEKWQDWSDNYKKYRQKIGKDKGRIMTLDGELLESIDTKITSESAIVGTNKEYARIHNEGGKVKKRGGKGKFEMPKRSFMNWTDELQELVADELFAHLKLQDYIDKENAKIKFLKGE